jgi:hypothetical protein
MSSTQKRCTKCGETKPVGEFNRNKLRRDGLRSECRRCEAAHRAANHEKIRAREAAYAAAHREERAAYNAAYRRDPEKVAVYNAARYRAFRDYTDSLKTDGCVDCGAQLPPSKLHWHHLDPATKVWPVSQMQRHRREVLDAEIAKCVLVCEPCHKARHEAMRPDPIERRRQARLNITPRPLRGRKLVA